MRSEMTGFIQNVFSEVTATYEKINHILAFGFDIAWRKRAARLAARAGAGQWADMCTGTGETASYLRRLAPEGTDIYGIDFSLPMLGVATRKPKGKDITFLASDIRALPFPDESFNLITMSFAARNVNLDKTTLIKTFAEIYRVLKSGGRFVNLETSRPPFSIVRRCFHMYVKLCVKSIGSRISGSRTAYAYLAGTIPRFYAAEELAEIMHQSGFEKVTFDRLLFGVAAIHQGIKQ
ncbi:MAG: ubiquinone/menaquinone biosynthesis methyltransferase [Candidatus Latescibacter sp.]|nr:ubiquinone/menaquinone biosynthesis methyltransferase [Candidatus Latescibacter sp.]